MKKNYKVGLCGYGYVGKAIHKVFPEALIYDPHYEHSSTKDEINSQCGMVIICVPTNPTITGALDMSIVESSVEWIQTPLIHIESALMPGTVDALKKKYNKRITVSVETVGEGNYFIPFWKYPDPKDALSHNFIIIGGSDDDAREVAEYYWAKMSPDINIHIITAVEAEICKLWENAWGAMKVTFANEMYEICKRYGANYMRTMQAWGADGRVEKMHMRVVSGKHGWKSKCWDKDCPALYIAGKRVGYKLRMIKTMLEANKHHLRLND